MKKSYILMSKETPVCHFNMETGDFVILEPALMPFNLFFKNEEGTIQEKISNINSFNAWCADRVLSMDRRHAKKILNELGISQSQDDSYKAKISRACRSVSLQDCFWLKQEGESTSWHDINLFTNHFSEALIPVALHGGSATIQNKHWKDVSQELSTNGTFAKAWGRVGDAIVLYKADDVDGNETLRETFASRILACFDVSHVSYRLGSYDGKRVSVCECMTSEELSIVPFRHFNRWCFENNKNAIAEVKKIDAAGYYAMNVMTYLIGNSDNHDGNWGFFRDNETGKLISLHPLFDFNCAFDNYNLPDGGSCIPENITHYEEGDDFGFPFEVTISLREAALEGIKHIDLKQLAPVTSDMFLSMDDFRVFQHRCSELGIQLMKAPLNDQIREASAISEAQNKANARSATKEKEREI